jgi:hypothetical protein
MLVATRGDRLIVGLSEANVVELRQDRPIVVDLQELGLADARLCITYAHESGRARVPDDWGDYLVLAVGPMGFDRLRGGEGIRMKLEINGTVVWVGVFVGENEQQLNREIRPLIGATTRVEHVGFAPGEWVDDN